VGLTLVRPPEVHRHHSHRRRTGEAGL